MAVDEVFFCLDLKLALDVGFHQYLPIPKLVVKFFEATHTQRCEVVDW